MTRVRRDLPSGTITFLFTDIEGSTRLLHELGAEAYAERLAEHRRLLRDAFARHGGFEIDTQGDAFFYAFPTGPDAVEAAHEGQEALSSSPIRVRIGLHTGTPHATEEGYVGEDVHKGARIAAAGHGGQVLLSKETNALVEVDVIDLGEHRLKDFDEPVWIFQLGEERFPPLRTISNTNLPSPASSFVGREKELEEVVSLLRDGARLLTLTGPGGTGKTRIAIEAAAELVPEFPNGVFWAGLGPLRDSALVLDTVAQTVGAKDDLADYIADRGLLLLLDNFEQVVDAAPEIAPLLEACPNLKLLITSRELLRISGEVEYAVPPLAEPEAVELFCARSQLEPDDAIAELCRRLDDLPLAVELAAARTSVLTPAQILNRFSRRLDLLKGGRDAEARQQTLRATIEWSHDLLGDHERTLFARLAVFAGGCTLAAAEEIVDADLDVLQSLVDKSLVRHTQDRFWMLETIRDYAAERLEGSGEAEGIRRRHAEHFLALAEEAEPHLRDIALQGPGEWLDRLEGEHDNLRAAMDLLEASGETRPMLRMAGALAEFWYQRGPLKEGRHRVEAALRADQQPTTARAMALIGAADLAEVTGDVATRKLRAEEAVALNLALGDPQGTADSMWRLGSAVGEGGDWIGARDLLEQTIGLFAELDDQHSLLGATRGLAWAHENLGDLERCRELHEDNLRRARALGNKLMEAITLGALAMNWVKADRSRDALPLLKESFPIYRDLGDPLQTTDNLCRSAHALAAVGRSDPAVRLVACAETLWEKIGAHPGWVVKMNEDTLSVARPQLDDAAFAKAWEEGRQLTADEAIALALDSLD
jgi:predicted ATPase/class 3 adenylate cyclase